jgi:hypothetical protein
MLVWLNYWLIEITGLRGLSFYVSCAVSLAAEAERSMLRSEAWNEKEREEIQEILLKIRGISRSAISRLKLFLSQLALRFN